MASPKYFRLALPAITLFLTVGCASTPIIPAQDYQAVRMSIDEALEEDGNRYAGEDMLAAQQKLNDAETAEQNGDEDAALRLLKEARLHAEYAEIAARQAQAQESLVEINAGLTALQRELAR